MNISQNALRNYIDQAFIKYDRDGSETLDIKQIKNFFNDVFYLAGYQTRINDYQAQQIMFMADKNNDHRCSKLELLNLFKITILNKEKQNINSFHNQNSQWKNNYQGYNNQNNYNQGYYGNQGSYGGNQRNFGGSYGGNQNRDWGW